MPIIKKFSPREKLETFSTFISTTSDVDTTSLYFRISELNEVLTGGKNGFLIEGSEHLKETTEIKIEILDVNGNTIYYEPGKGTPDYYEGLSKVVSVHVYPDTPIGLATITIMGELKTFVDNNGGVREVPDEWKGIYNVKWETTVKVNRNLPNEDKVRFYKRPTIEIDEIVKPIFNTQIPTVTQSGVVTGFPIVPESGVLLDNFTDPTFYRLRISGSESWSLSVVGSEISIPSVNYNPTVLDVVNSKDITVSPPFTINGRVSELVEVDYTSSFLNREDRLNTDSPLSGSFARIKISDLKTFVGDVNRVKVFRRSESSLGDFEFIQEIELESNELLIDFDVAGKVQEKYGLFTEPVITEYWNSSSMDVQFNQNILFNSVNFQPDGVGQFFTNKTIPIDDGVEYTLSFGARLSGSYSSEDYIRAFISGSNTNTEFLKLKATDLLKEKRTVNQNIIPIVEDDVQLYFEVVGNGWFINNVSIRASQETAFSPDEITFIQSVPRQLQIETFDYKFEFYDINNNYIPVRVEKTKEFAGGNTTLITRGLEVIPSNQFFTYNSSGEATGQTTILFDIRRDLLTGSVTFASSAFDESGTLIDSSEYIGGQYPGLLIDQTNESAVLTAANFTGSNDDITVQYVIYEASCEDQTANVLIGRVADGRSGLGAGYVEASSVSFVRKDDKTFIPTSASLTSYFRDREDFQIQITSSILVYPSYSFDDGIDRNFIWYEITEPNVNTSIRLRDSNGDEIIEGEPNAVQTDTATVEFTYTDSIGETIIATETVVIVSDGDKGDDSIVIDITPANFVFTKDETGLVENFSDGNTTVRVLQGNTPLKYDQDLTEAGTWATQSIVSTNITIGNRDVDAETNLILSELSNLQGNVAFIEYNLIARPFYRNEFNTESVEIDTIQAFTSVRDGTNSRIVRLFSTAYDVIYDADFPQSGVSPISPIGAITLTAFQFNHTGSVFYEFYKDDVLEFGPTLTNTLVIPSGEMPFPDERAVWEVRTKENTTTSTVIATDNLDIIGSKSGRDARDISISFNPSYFIFTSSIDILPTVTDLEVSIVTQNITGFTTNSISFRSGSNTDFVSWNDFFTGKPNPPTLNETNNVYTFTLDYEDHINGRENLPLSIRAQQTVFGQTIRDIETISFVESGDNGEDAPPIYRAEIVQNGNVTIPVSVFGAPNFSDSGVTIIGYKDEVPLTGSISTPTTNEYSASIFAKSTFITASGVVSADEDGIVFGNITGWTNPNINKTGFITYKVTFENESPPIERFVTQRLNTTSDGETGPGIVFRGEWTGSVDYKFQENNRRDAVLYDSGSEGEGVLTYYATLQESGISTTPIQPTGSSNSAEYWEELGQEDFFVAAKIAIFEESFVKNTLNVGTPKQAGSSEAAIVIDGKNDKEPYISIGQQVIGFQQTGIFQGVTGSIGNEVAVLSLQSATGSDGTYNSLEWDGENLLIRGGIRQTSAGITVTESINRGTWASESIYQIGEIVQYGELNLPTASYSAIQAHTASFVNNPPSESFWSPFAVGRNGEDGLTGDKGDIGDTGLQGPGIVYRGEWSGSVEYIRTDERRDVVKSVINNEYYITKQTHTSTGADEPPNGIDFSTYWETFGATFTSIATSFILTEDAVATRSISVGENAAITIFGSGSNPYISIGQDINEQGFQQTGIFQGISGSNEVAVFSLQSASSDNGLSWDGSTLEVNGTVNITGESKISDRVIVGENESITIFGSDNSPYISIGQLPASQSFELPGIFLGTNAAGTGSLSIVSTTSGLTWNGTNLNVNGTINAPAGNIGCFNINQGVLQSCNNRISIDTVNNVMEVRDNDDNVKFIANTQTGLPNPFVSDSGTFFTTESTHEISACIAAGGGFGFESYVCTMNETGSFGIFTPSITSTYTVRWNYRGTGSDPKSLVSVYACGPESFSEATLRLQIVSSSGALITESTPTSITAAGGKAVSFFCDPEFGGIPSIFYSSTDQCVTFPNTVFNVNAPLVSGSTYCILVSKTALIQGFGGTSNPDGCTLPLSSCVLSTVCRDNPTYNATPSYTIVNGGGLQSVVDEGEYFRTLKLGQFNQSVQIGGGLHLVGCELNKRFIRFNPSGSQAQFWVVNSLGNENQISGTVCKSGLVFGQGERPNSNVICTGWGTGEALMTLTTGGALITKGTVTQNVGTLSDNRLKDDLTIINSPIDKISHINGYTYTWNSSSYTPGKLDGGVVAQDVEKSMPLLVGTTTIDSSEYKTVSYNGIIGLLVESVKELSNEICTLRSELHKIKCGCILTK